MKIKLAVNKAYLISEINREQFKVVEQYAPHLLTLKNPESGEALYRLSFKEDAEKGAITKYGVEFNEVTVDGYPCLAVDMPGLEGLEREDKIKKLAEKFAPYRRDIEAIEHTVITVYASVKDEALSFVNQIDIML